MAGVRREAPAQAVAHVRVRMGGREAQGLARRPARRQGHGVAVGGGEGVHAFLVGVAEARAIAPVFRLSAYGVANDAVDGGRVPVGREGGRLLGGVAYRPAGGGGGVLEACRSSASSSCGGKERPLLLARRMIPAHAVGTQIVPRRHGRRFQALRQERHARVAGPSRRIARPEFSMPDRTRPHPSPGAGIGKPPRSRSRALPGRSPRQSISA